MLPMSPHTDNDGVTLLHQAAANKKFGSQHIEWILANYEVEINATDKRGNTPLHIAARHLSDPVAITRLIATGADPSLKNKKGETPLAIAMRFANSKVLNAFNEDSPSRFIAKSESNLSFIDLLSEAAQDEVFNPNRDGIAPSKPFTIVSPLVTPPEPVVESPHAELEEEPVQTEPVDAEPVDEDRDVTCEIAMALSDVGCKIYGMTVSQFKQAGKLGKVTSTQITDYLDSRGYRRAMSRIDGNLQMRIVRPSRSKKVVEPTTTAEDRIAQIVDDLLIDGTIGWMSTGQIKEHGSKLGVPMKGITRPMISRWLNANGIEVIGGGSMDDRVARSDGLDRLIAERKKQATG